MDRRRFVNISIATNAAGELKYVRNFLYHPDDMCVDDDKNLFVAQWNAGNVYPLKLNRI